MAHTIRSLFGGNRVIRVSPKPWVRTVAQISWDALAWASAVFIAWALRFDFSPPLESIGQIAWLVAAVIVAQISFGFLFGIYRGRFRTGSIDEVSAIALASGIMGIGATLIVLTTNPVGVPRSVPLIAAFFALVFMLSARILLRLVRLRTGDPLTTNRALVYGAGHLGESLVRLMLTDPHSSFRPVGLLDDDPRKRNFRSYGVAVKGGIDHLASVRQRTGANTLIVAISRIDSSQIRRLTELCKSLNMEIRIVPRTAELVTKEISLNDLSAVSMEDLLGRKPVETDVSAVASLLSGQRVLITGAGGSIGAELARQINNFHPSFLGLLDRDESSLQALELALDGRGLMQAENLILADIRDAQRVAEVFQTCQPSIVFHAAALKHLPMLEAHPGEAVKTNVLGTANLLQAALDTGVQTFVNISTDKAADPTSVLGLSKLITEKLIAGGSTAANQRFLSVRFGNVLGSRGSVLNTFRSQINSGSAVTVTDPEVTRYFMTAQEAIQLVLQAAVLGKSGSTLILDMGEPVRIDDVARQLIELSGKQVPIEYVGLRSGEKLHEMLQSGSETATATDHPLITAVRVEPLHASFLQTHLEEDDPLGTLRELSGYGLNTSPKSSGVAPR